MSGVPRRIADLVDLHGLPAGSAERLKQLLDVVATDPAAPTTVVDPAVAVDVHLADSLVALELAPVRAAARIADIGAGAGFPGLPLAIALPGARVHLVESVGRKVAFLARAVQALGLTNVETESDRAESWHAGLGRCDLVTARAVAPLGVLVEYAAPLLGDQGALVAWKGRRDAGEEADAAAASAATGLMALEVRPVQPWPDAEHRHLHLYLKVASTPSRYPRRPGMARKRPITAST